MATNTEQPKRESTKEIERDILNVMVLTCFFFSAYFSYRILDQYLPNTDTHRMLMLGQWLFTAGWGFLVQKKIK